MSIPRYLPRLDQEALRGLAGQPWVYLGLSRDSRRKLLAALGERSALDTKRLFHATAERVLPGFEQILATILRQGPEDGRQLYQAAEGNLFNIPGVRDAILYFMFLELARSEPGVNLFCDCPRLWNFILDRHGHDPGLAMDTQEPVPVRARDLAWETKAFLDEATFRRTPGPAAPPGRAVTLLHCWATLALAERGDCLAVHYGPLPGFLEENGADVRIMFIILEQGESFHRTRRILQASHPKAIFPESLLDDADLAASAAEAAPDASPFGPVLLNGADLTGLLDPLDFKGGGYAACSARKFVRVFARLAEQGLNIAKFIYLFENQNWERQCLQGLRTFHPGAGSIGFQHTQIPRYWGLSPAPERSALLPAPDLLVCNGENSRARMAECWGGKCEVRTGPALRHAYLHAARPASSRPALTLGVAGCALPDQTAHLCAEACRALSLAPAWSAVFRFHPDNTPELIEACLGPCRRDPDLGRRISVARGGQGEFLDKISLLTAPGTSLLTDAALLGLPTLQFRACHDFDLIYLGLEHPFVEDAAGLASHLARFAREGASATPVPHELSHFYHPVTEQTLRVFAS